MLLTILILYSHSNCCSIILLVLVSPELNPEKIQVQMVYLGGEGNVWETARTSLRVITTPSPAQEQGSWDIYILVIG